MKLYRVITIFCAFLSGSTLGQAPLPGDFAPYRMDLSDPEHFLYSPSGLNGHPGYKVIEMSEQATRHFLNRQYLSGVDFRHIFHDADSLQAEFNVSTATARKAHELYKQTSLDVEKFVFDSIREPCARGLTGESDLRQWATYFNNRQDTISEYYARLLDDIDLNVSSDLAERIRQQVDALAHSASIPIRYIGLNPEASHGVLLGRYAYVCSP